MRVLSAHRPSPLYPKTPTGKHFSVFSEGYIKAQRYTLFCFFTKTIMLQGFPDGSVVKNLLANAGDLGLIPGQEDSLEEEMATHSSILALEIPLTEKSGGLQSLESKESDTTQPNHNSICYIAFYCLFFFFFHLKVQLTLFWRCFFNNYILSHYVSDFQPEGSLKMCGPLTIDGGSAGCITMPETAPLTSKHQMFVHVKNASKFKLHFTC